MPLITAFTSLNPRFADLFKHPFCNVVSVVAWWNKKACDAPLFSDCVSAPVLSDERWLPNIQLSLLCSKQMCFKVKSFFCDYTKAMECVLRTEQKDVINPSDRGTMHSSLQMVQTLNLLPSWETLSLSANQKIRAPCQNKLWFGWKFETDFLIFSLFTQKKNRLLISLFYCKHIVQHLEESLNQHPCWPRPQGHVVPLMDTRKQDFNDVMLRLRPLSWWQWRITRVPTIVVRTCSISPELTFLGLIRG